VKWFIVLLLLAAVSYGQRVTPIQVPKGHKIGDFEHADVNGDGLVDVILSTTVPAPEGAPGSATSRALSIYLQRKGNVPFESDPDHVLAPVYKDAVAFAVADVHPDKGSEVVFLTAKGVFAWRPTVEGKHRAVRIAECEFLWQIPFRSVSEWSHVVVDLNGDSLPDFVIPEPDGYRVIMQTARGKFAEPQLLVVPAGLDVPDANQISSRSRRTRMVQKYSGRVEITGGGEMVRRTLGPLVDISDRTPAAQYADWDADGKLDIIVRTEKRMYVWTADKANRFGDRPTADLAMPVVADRKRRLEVSYSAHIVDLDLDGRADSVVFSGDQRSKDIRTQVQFFTQRGGKPLFGKKGLPDQLLVLAGFAGLPSFNDINGDGYPDMFAASVRPDLLDSIRGGSAQNLDAELYVFLSRKGRFEREPDLLHRTEIKVEGMRASRSVAVVDFFGDVTGDGMHDLLLRTSAETISIFMVRASRSGLKVISKPVYELRVDEHAQVHIGPHRGKKAPDLYIVEEGQMLHVRFP
jgi:hypothetical protein